MITIFRPVSLNRVKRGRRRLSSEPPPTKVLPKPRTPRISKLMALAIRFAKLVHTGQVSDQSELSRLARVTQPRITQIMNLNHLAPDIQEELLHLPAVESGKDPIHEKMLRPVAGHIDWTRQRELWGSLKRSDRKLPGEKS